MKPEVKILLLAGLVIIPAGAIAMYQRVRSGYDIEYKGLVVKSITNNNIKMDMLFAITNTTGFNAILLPTTFDIVTNGTMLGTAISPVKTAIPDKMITTFVTNISIDKMSTGASIFSYIWSKIMGENSALDINVKGICGLQVDAPVLKNFTISIAIDETVSF